jgi:hypothetical protein
MFTHARAMCRLALSCTLAAVALELYPMWLAVGFVRRDEVFSRWQSLGAIAVATVLDLAAIAIAVLVFDAQKARASHHFRPYARNVITLALMLLPSSGVLAWLSYRLGS